MQGSSFRLTTAAACVLLLTAPALALDDGQPIADPSGFWLVAEHGPPVNEGLASIPLIGLAVRAQIGNPRAVWEIRKDGDRYAIVIPSRSLEFREILPDAGRLKGDLPDPSSTNGRISVDVAVADGRLSGRLAYPTYGFDLDGRLPDSVESLRRELAGARARLAEIDGPYIVPEIERLRQENVVLIQRIRRVEDELRRRGGSPAPVEPPRVAGSPPRVSTQSLTDAGVAGRTTELKSEPSATSETRATVPAGQPLHRLADAAVAGWILVADQRGVVGFAPAANLAAASANSPAAAPRGAREILVSFPQWDPGRAGKRMTVADPGFVSLVGRIRGDAQLREIRIADAQTVFNPDGSFTSVMPVSREGRKVRIEALFASGPPALLEFEILVGK